jgi:hypothetical protein
MEEEQAQEQKQDDRTAAEKEDDVSHIYGAEDDHVKMDAFLATIEAMMAAPPRDTLDPWGTIQVAKITTDVPPERYTDMMRRGLEKYPEVSGFEETERMELDPRMRLALSVNGGKRRKLSHLALPTQVVRYAAALSSVLTRLSIETWTRFVGGVLVRALAIEMRRNDVRIAFCDIDDEDGLTLRREDHEGQPRFFLEIDTCRNPYVEGMDVVLDADKAAVLARAAAGEIDRRTTVWAARASDAQQYDPCCLR